MFCQIRTSSAIIRNNMKKQLFVLSVLSALCSVDARAEFAGIHTMSSVSGTQFVSYEKQPGAAPVAFSLEDAVVSVYKFDRNRPAPVFNVNDWDGEMLNTPGLYGPVPAAALDKFSKAPQQLKTASRYVIVLSHPSYPDWFAVAGYEYYEAVWGAANAMNAMITEAGEAAALLRCKQQEEMEFHSVPEPASALLALAGAALLFARRRK